jgi:heterodisulfide reductase subunit A-like polyferredoxin
MSDMQPSARRIGVYVCHCGGNISDYVDVEAVVDAVKDEPGVVVAKDMMFACSDAGQQEMEKDIAEQNLDGLVAAWPSGPVSTHTSTARPTSASSVRGPTPTITRAPLARPLPSSVAS